MGLVRRTHDYELYKRGGTVAIVDIDSGELELPEELPAFPYESELIQEIQSVICEYGGTEGVALLKEHAKEMARDTAAVYTSKNDHQQSSEALGQLEKMISKFERLSSQVKSK